MLTQRRLVIQSTVLILANSNSQSKNTTQWRSPINIQVPCFRPSTWKSQVTGTASSSSTMFQSPIVRATSTAGSGMDGYSSSASMAPVAPSTNTAGATPSSAPHTTTTKSSRAPSRSSGTLPWYQFSTTMTREAPGPLGTSRSRTTGQRPTRRSAVIWLRAILSRPSCYKTPTKTWCGAQRLTSHRGCAAHTTGSSRTSS